MTGYPYRTVFVWGAVLALFWLAACSPWSVAWNLGIGTAVALVACIALAAATRRIRAGRAASRQVLSAMDSALRTLPGNIRRNTPLVLAVGESSGVLARAFGNDVVHVTDVAIWVRVEDPVQLKYIADALKRWREGQGPDAVAYLVDTDSTVDAATLTAATLRWRTAVDETSRAVGYALPVCVAVYAAESAVSQLPCPWFGLSGVLPSQRSALTDQIAASALAHARWVAQGERARWAYRVAQLDAAARWAAGALLPGLTDSGRGTRSVNLVAFGVTAAQGAVSSDSLVGHYANAITGLKQPSLTAAHARLPLPDALLRGIALQPMQHPLPRALAHAFVGLAVALCAAAGASAWQNRALVARIQANMMRYQAVPPEHDAARSDALSALRRDRTELERYARSGLPPRLSLGFYRAGALLPTLNTLIASYQPPEPPPPMIELNGLSLFKTGNAQLNPGSNRVMFGALEMIKAHPDKRVLVAGHTDSTGNPANNMKLSEARAASVRDWLADASGIPLSHFAIQGYGDTRPKAPNDTDAGRAANRRVEITLIPDCRSDGTTARATHSPPGQPACSFE
ncbi:OmpA family protein [Ralstonia soli]|uniref:OmpA family protein n=1 Tax=Ralstonia soli TaxID=2953896 RepID=A0ABT1AH74_9RALS|nr:OmpA family protein [Ralstonia soli]MCO5397754.1 OmpA family protein [Ralstonia soli]